MKEWNFQVKSSPEEISKKLESSLGVAKSFVLNMDRDKNNFLKFRIRRRALLAFEITLQNNIIVNGKIGKAATHKDTDVEILFTHHTFSKLLIFLHLFLGLGLLAGLLLEASGNSYMYLVGGILLAIGILFGLHVQRNFDKNVQEYKLLISDILEICTSGITTEKKHLS